MMRNFKWLVPMCLAMSLAACSSMNMAANGEDKEEAEEGAKIKLSEAPEAVRATLAKETNNAAIDDLEKQNENGKTVYEADVMVGGAEREIRVAQDGKLISNKAEEDDEKGEGKEEEKNEKE